MTRVPTASGRRVSASAVFDPTGRYRYLLSRVWSGRLPRCCFVMLNPSAADATTDDPTVRRCASFAGSWGYGGVDVVNVFGLRATVPAALRYADDPVGPGNDEAVLAAARDAGLVVAAWGDHGAWRGRDVVVRRMLEEAGTVLSCLRLTKRGHPGHPLYVPARATPRPYP